MSTARDYESAGLWPEFVTVDELAMLRKLKRSWIYEQTRRNRLPGLYRIGRFVRVDLEAFDAATKVS